MTTDQVGTCYISMQMSFVCPLLLLLSVNVVVQDPMSYVIQSLCLSKMVYFIIFFYLLLFLV